MSDCRLSHEDGFVEDESVEEDEFVEGDESLEEEVEVEVRGGEYTLREGQESLSL